MIRHNCPSCDKSMKAPVTLAGKTIRCPACGERSVLPTVAPASVESGSSIEEEKPEVSTQASDDDFVGFEEYTPPPKPREVTSNAMSVFEIEERKPVSSRTDSRDIASDQKSPANGNVKLLMGMGAVIIALMLVIIVMISASGDSPIESGVVAESSNDEMKGNPDSPQVSTAPLPVVMSKSEELKTVPFPGVASAISVMSLSSGNSGFNSSQSSPRSYGGTMFLMIKLDSTIENLKAAKNAVLQYNNLQYLPVKFGYTVGEQFEYRHQSFKHSKIVDATASISEPIDVLVYSIRGGSGGVAFIEFPTMKEYARSDMFQWQYYRPQSSSSFANRYVPGQTSTSHTQRMSSQQVDQSQIPKISEAVYMPQLFYVNANGTVTASRFGNSGFLAIKFDKPINEQVIRNCLLEVKVGNKTSLLSSTSMHFGQLQDVVYLTNPEEFKNIGFNTVRPSGNQQIIAAAFYMRGDKSGTARIQFRNRPFSGARSNEVAIKEVVPVKESQLNLSKRRVRSVEYKGRVIAKMLLASNSNLKADLAEIKGVTHELNEPLGRIIGFGADDELVYIPKGKNVVRCLALNAGAKESEVTAPVGDSLFAVGGNKLVVYIKRVNVFKVYELQSGKLLNTFSNPYPGSVINIIMGRSSGDRCCALYRYDDKPYLGVVNPEDGTPSMASVSMSGLDDYIKEGNREGVYGRANMDLTDVVLSKTRRSTVHRFSYDSMNSWAEARKSAGVGAVPLPNGALLHADNGYYEKSGSQMRLSSHTRAFPIFGYNLYLKLTTKDQGLSICGQDLRREIVSLGKVPWPEFGSNEFVDHPEIDRYVYYNGVSGNLVLTHPEGKSVLIVRSPLKEKLAAGGNQFMYLRELPIQQAVKGEKWSYAIDGVSSMHTYKIIPIDLPKGMEVVDKGLAWSVPQSAPGLVHVEFKLSDGSFEKVVKFDLQPSIKRTYVKVTLPDGWDD